MTKEERVRKERPPSRIKFAESSQPDYVMMGLEKVSLVYGDAEIIKDATFSVATGERVGLVGPNGGGKVMRMLTVN
jgi:ATPase subunit of ABC transporter with duplicated ATPase domains